MSEGSVTIYKIGKEAADPDLMLEMLRRNFDNIESLVVSACVNGRIEVFRTSMSNADLAFHLFVTQQEITEVINEPPPDDR